MIKFFREQLLFFHPAFLTAIFLSVVSQAEPLSRYQWGIKNSGLPQTVDIDPLQVYKVSSRSNEDIHVPYQLNNKKNPHNSKIIVAVLDTGIDYNHPDLKNQIVTKPSECLALQKYQRCLQENDKKQCDAIWYNKNNIEVDLDKNGYPMDCHGWSILGGINPMNIMGHPDFDDDQGHGTHVAGIIAADPQNNYGLTSIAENILILPVQVIGIAPSEPLKPLSIAPTTASIFDDPNEENLKKNNRTLGDLVARGLIYAIRSGAEVINMSLGWPKVQDSTLLREAIREAQEKGVFIVAAAGNDSTRAILQPCVYENVICVGAHSPDGSLTHFSNYGSGVDIAAPGLNILSAFPFKKRPIRFRSTLGFEYLSGTSQATPFVSAVIAEMIALGIPKSEIYPRLIAGARTIKETLPLLQGPAHIMRELGVIKTPYQKYIWGGNLDFANSVQIQPQPLLSPQIKEKNELLWDRKSDKLSWLVHIKNRWLPIQTNKIELSFNFAKPYAEALRPIVISATPFAPYDDIWQTNEVRVYQVIFSMAKGFPSELELFLNIKTPWSEKQYVLESDIIVPVNEQFSDEDVQVISIENMPKGRYSLLPIDENLDFNKSQKDYFVISQKQNIWQVAIAKYSDNYYVTTPTRITVSGEIDNIREQILTRIDLNSDGESEYVLGLLEEFETKAPKMSFYVFNEKAQVFDQYTYDNEIAPIPFQIYWHQINGTKKPAWVGSGKKPNKKRSLRDLWENPSDNESTEIRFYYLDEKNQLQAIQKHENYQIIDILEPNIYQQAQGRIPVLLSKNAGTESKPSYLYELATAEVINGKIQNFKLINIFNDTTYRNMLDTRVDRVMNLDQNINEYAGNFWFGEGAHGQQRLTLFEPFTSIHLDTSINPVWKYLDAALWIRAAYSGKYHVGAFVFTNSEIQYHGYTLGSDSHRAIINSSVVTKSMEKYSFFPSNVMISLYMPLTIQNTSTGGGQNNTQDPARIPERIPAIFTTESSELNRGVKILVPQFDQNGSVREIIAPAHLRLKASIGCKPLDTPVFDAQFGAHSLDYFCGNKILRFKLKSQ